MPALISRTGYTGEDGFEVYLHPDHAGDVWDAILKAGQPHGILPAGLGARDTLRLEACLALYGNDIDDAHTPWEANLGWIVKMKKGDFQGRDALAKQKEAGVPRKLVGFEVTGRGIARHGYPARGGRRLGRGDVRNADSRRSASPSASRTSRRGEVRAGHGADDRRARPRRPGRRRSDAVLQAQVAFPLQEKDMSAYPDDRRYTRSHEWIRVDGDVGTIGISDHAQKELGEIVFVELPDTGEIFDAGQEFGTIESVKAVSEIFLPVAGEILETTRFSPTSPAP